jgi:hypothetical protein
MSYLCYFCLFTYSGVNNVLTIWYIWCLIRDSIYQSRAPGFTPDLWWGPCCSIFFVFCVLFLLVLCRPMSCVVLCLVLPVSLDCPFLITLSIFSNAYLVAFVLLFFCFLLNFFFLVFDLRLLITLLVSSNLSLLQLGRCRWIQDSRRGNCNTLEL